MQRRPEEDLRPRGPRTDALLSPVTGAGCPSTTTQDSDLVANLSLSRACWTSTMARSRSESLLMQVAFQPEACRWPNHHRRGLSRKTRGSEARAPQVKPEETKDREAPNPKSRKEKSEVEGEGGLAVGRTRQPKPVTVSP